MKQYITQDQYHELSDNTKNIWYEWFVKHHPESIVTLPSIGLMIEFLDENELCDGLWRAVKEKLNE